MGKKKIILDASPSVDNYFGIKYALENFDVRALILNNDKENHETLKKNLSFLNESYSLPENLVWGSEESFLKVKNKWNDYNKILINNNDVDKEVKVLDKKPWDVIYDIAKEEEGITIVTLSSLTNIALSIFKYEKLIDYINEIVIMGGTTDIGNVGPYSEANFARDPYSAEAIMNSGVKITTVGLNILRQSAIELNELKLDKEENKILSLIKSNKDIYCYDEGTVLGDIVVLSYVKNREILETDKFHSTVEFKSDLCLGRQNIDIRKHCEEEPNCDIAMEINIDLYIRELKRFFNKKDLSN